jgi:xanthine dehydrogenase accessory factor
LALCEQVLRRGDFRYLGLIGSASKRARFERRLRDGGIAQSDIDRLTCPIGVPGIPGKTPAEIAIGVAAQLLQV